MGSRWKGATWTVFPRFYRVRFLDAEGGLLSEHFLHALGVEHAQIIAWGEAESDILQKTRQVKVDESEPEE